MALMEAAMVTARVVGAAVLPAVARAVVGMEAAARAVSMAEAAALEARSLDLQGALKVVEEQVEAVTVTGHLEVVAAMVGVLRAEGARVARDVHAHARTSRGRVQMSKRAPTRHAWGSGQRC